ncbi:hypothetical protein LCGC14_0665100 [marine sediment metagenome]|uniref:Transglycosylase SLT domain-containing protein n=1 Tax=marine sediment metagenome TaxID=412755 RepID=A0A0F9TDY3_9ZZZZ
MPSHYESLARTYATQAGIDPDIFVAQINQESGFRTDLGSSAGAQGIAQIIPRYHPGVDPWDPDASLRYAANLVAGHLRIYGGDIRKALTAYHAGPGILNRAMELGGGDWEGSIFAAASEFFPQEADRIGRDNATYLANILGGGTLAPRPGQPTLPAAAQETRPLEFFQQFGFQQRQRLKQISEQVFGQPPDRTPQEPFPGFLDLLRPFERENNFNSSRLESIDLEISILLKDVPAPSEIISPFGLIDIGFLGTATNAVLSALPFGPGVDVQTGLTEEASKELELLRAERDNLFARHNDLARFFTAVELQFDILQEIDPEVRAEAQAALDQLVNGNSTIQQQMMDPVLAEIRRQVEEQIDLLSTMTPEEIAILSESDITEKLFEQGRARPVASYLLSTEQLRLSLKGFRPSGPEELQTGEEIRNVLMAQGLDSEEAQAYREDTLARVQDRLAAYKELEQNIASLRTGQGDWSLPKPGTAAYLKTLAVQPILVASQALEKYFEGVVRPIAGQALYYPALIIPGEQKIERDMNIALEDANFWQAAGDAWNANTWHPVAKFAFETLADPTTYIGWGIATKLVRPLPILGRPLSRMVAAAEYGYLQAASAPFRIVGSGLRGIIKRPAATLGLLEGERVSGLLVRFLTRANPDTEYGRLTASQATESLGQALKRGTDFPEGIGLADLGTQVSKTLKSQAVPDVDTVLGWSQRVGGTVTKDTLLASKTILLDLETQLVMAAEDPKKAGLVARQLMVVLGVEDAADGKGFRLVKSLVDNYISTGERQAERLIQGDSLEGIISSIAQFSEKLTVSNHQSLAAGQAERLGILSIPLQKVPEGIGAVWSGSVERWVIRPIARSYLLFGMYHLWNIAETKGKASLAGINPFYRGNRSQMILNSWADSLGTRPEVLLGGGRGLVWGESYATVQQARKGVEKFLAPQWVSRMFREELAIRIQAADQVLIQHQLGLRELKRLLPQVWDEIDKVQRATGMDFRFLPKDLRPWAQDATEANLLRGPDAIRGMPGEATAERLRTLNIEKMLGDYDLIDSHVGDFILTQAKSGRLFTNTDEVGQEVVDLIWDTHLRSPEFFSVHFEEMAEEILTAPINNWEDFSKRLMTLQGMSRGYGGVLEHQYGIAREASEKVVRASDNDAIWDVWRGSSDVFGNRAGHAIDRYIESLQGHIGAVGDRSGDVSLLMNRYKALKTLEASAYSRRRDIAEGIFGKSAPKGARPKTNEQWLKAKEQMGQPFRDIAIAKEALVREVYTLEARIGQQAKNAVPDVAGRTISRVDVALMYNIRPDDVSSMTMLSDLQAIMGKDEFTQELLNRAVINLEPGQDLAALGWTKEAVGEVWDDIMREFRLNPENVSRISPTLMQVEDLVRGVRFESKGAELSAEARTAFQRWADDMADGLGRIEGYGGAPWLQAKGEALDTATTEFYRMFPDYVDLNYLDKFFRSQMPFWVYEWHRLWYLPRQFMRTPGLITGLGRYNEATGGDNYIHVPFTSLEINPLRGTILMGGLRRLLIRDYPEFYDTFSKGQQVLDMAGRFGFYPGAHVTIGNLLFGTGKGPAFNQLGELVPVWMKAPIQGFQAFAELIGNKTMMEASKRLANVFIPERFRSYMIAMKVSQIGEKDPDTGEVISGADLLNKTLAGSPLDPFEQELWDRATGQMSPTFILLDQTGLFRFRPEELTEARAEYDIIVSEYTGFTTEQLRDMRNWGIRWQDIIPPTPEVRDLLSATESLERFSGFTNVLFGAAEQQFRARRNEFWDDIDSLRLGLTAKQEEMDCQFGFAGATQCDHPGSITARNWIKLHSGLGADYQSGFDALRERDRYKDIPVTHEEVVEYYQRTGQPLPTEHPMVELLRMYYDIELQEVFDSETGTLGPDFDTFYIQREILLQAAGERRDELEDQIRQYESELEKLHRWSYVQYLRPYFNRRDLTIERFAPDAQLIIRRWLASDSPLERDRLEAIELDGRSLIGRYQADIKLAGQNLRFYSPDIDAWLAFWQVTDSFRTDEGQRRYEILMQRYRPGSDQELPKVDDSAPVLVLSSGEGGDD